MLGDIHLERATHLKDNDLYLKAANLYKRTLVRSRLYLSYDEEHHNYLDQKLKETCKQFCIFFNGIPGQYEKLQAMATHTLDQLFELREYTKTELKRIQSILHIKFSRKYQRISELNRLLFALKRY